MTRVQVIFFARNGFSNLFCYRFSFRLATSAKIIVPDWRIEKIAGKPVLISRRFDRTANKRISYLSAMSMLGANVGVGFKSYAGANCQPWVPT